MKNKNTTVSKNERIFKAMCMGLIVGFAVCVFLLVLCSFILVKTGSLSDNTFTTFSFIITAITTFLVAYVALKILKHHGLFFGATVSFMLFLFFTVLGFWLSREPFSLFTIAKFFIMIFMGAFGGIVGANR